MKVLMCINGHYFDTDKYAQCPHCGAGVGNGEKPNTMSVNFGNASSQIIESAPKKEKKSLFGKKKEERTYSQSFGAANPVTGMQATPIQPVVPNVNVMQRPEPSQAVMSNARMPQGDNPTISIWEQEAQVTQSHSTIPVQQEEQPAVTPAPQFHQISQAGKADDVRTVAIYGSDTEPVTGWLVCIKGECYGEGFNISAGRNNIGRGTNMDIAIVGETTISREKQAIIIFEPNKQQFIMQPGESGSLTYVNDELLLNFVELKPYDIIQMGSAKFVFVPLCCERFNWNDYLDE